MGRVSQWDPLTVIIQEIVDFRITELDCGALSSGSESDDSSDDVDVDVDPVASIFATPSHDDDQSPEEGEVENDVDDETMSGKAAWSFNSPIYSLNCFLRTRSPKGFSHRSKLPEQRIQTLVLADLKGCNSWFKLFLPDQAAC